MPGCNSKTMEGVRLDCRPSVYGTSSTEEQILGQNHGSCSVPLKPFSHPTVDLMPVDSIQPPALPLRETTDSASPPVVPAFAWHPPGWLETPELLPPTVLAHVMGMYELRACSCLLLREQWLCPHGYIQGQTQLRLFIWKNLSNLDTSFYAPELRQVALDLKGAKTYVCLLRLERAGSGICKTLLQTWVGYLLTSWVFFLSSFFSPPSPPYSLSLSFPSFLLLLLPLCSIRMHLWLFPRVWAYRH